jgi:hypothetical protein
MSNIVEPHLIKITSCIPVKSFTSEDIYYISILYNKYKKNLEFNCTCGFKFNMQNRNNCKHITEIKKSLNENNSSQKEQLNNIFFNFNKLNI